MDKLKLDEILKRHKAQPVGWGYIDIVVARDYYKDFISDLVNNENKIESISWWEWCSNNNESKYGIGGPKSNYVDGWFSELSIDVDDIDLGKTLEKKQLIKEIIDKIEAKTISFSDESVTFKHNSCLT